MRAIEAALADEDPALDELLSAPLPTEVVITRTAWSLLAASMSLLIFGAIVSDAPTMAAAALVLEFSLAVLLVVAAGPHSWRGEDEGEDAHVKRREVSPAASNRGFAG